MIDTDLASQITAAMTERRLLTHPFYRRWEQGQVTMTELAGYAAQYRYFEAFLPGFLTALAAELPEGTARDLVLANLADELGDPIAHVELFERFAEGVGAADDAPSPATTALLDEYRSLLVEGPVAALAGFVAYETQASDVARTKADGLRRHHGLDDRAVSFWEHHAHADAQHGQWALEALASLVDDPSQVLRALRRGADAWWTFLDERELSAA